MNKRILKIGKSAQKFLHSITRAPYPNMPWLILAYVVMGTLILNQGGVFTGHVIGYDDQVRMTQVLNWINGAGWYDRTIMRANPPEGFTSIWSRIVDIPIAAIIIVAQQFVPQKIAALVAAALLPLIELAILFVAAPYFVRPLAGKKKARLIILFVIFSSILNIKYFSASGFLVGQVSHHPWYVILDLTMFGAAARLAMGSFSLEPVMMLGISVALLTAVGIEGYPMIAGTTGLLALTSWAFSRPAVALRGGQGLLVGAVLSLLLLPMHQPPQNWLTSSFVEPSILGVLLVAIAGIFLLIERVVLRSFLKAKRTSAIILCVVAALVGCALIYAFPDMLNGAAAGLSPAERKMALHEHFEAQSLYMVSRTTTEFVCIIMPIVIAVIAGLIATFRASGRRRAVAFCYLGFAALGGGMSSLFSRYYHHAMTTACAWLLWVWEWAKKNIPKNIHYSLNALAVFTVLGPLWMLLIPRIVNDAPITSQVLLFPSAIQAAYDPCDSLPVANYIDEHYGKDTLLVVPYWESAQFLYQTDVRLDFLANYPSHDKFIDNYALFGSRDMQTAKDIILRHGIELIAACTDPLMFAQGYPDQRQSFIGLLQVGHVPAWLKLVKMGIPTNYVLYEVDKEALAKDTK